MEKRRELVDFSRKLRRSQTEAEKALWRKLRNRQLAGVKFRRQQPIGPFVVDFACLARDLVIELDGGQHGEKIIKRRIRIGHYGWSSEVTVS